MKIALLTPTFSKFSGIDRVVELNAKDMIKTGHSVTIMCLEGDIKLPKAKIIKIGMPKNQTLSRIYRLLFFLDFIKIKKSAKKLKGYDKVISHFYPMNLIASRGKKDYKVKYIYHNHGVPPCWTFTRLHEKIYIWTFNKLSNKSLKNCDQAYSISGYLRDVLKKETGIKSKVIYDPIDTKRFHKGIDGSKIRQKHKISPKDTVLFYNGRISPHKGVHLLIKAYKQIIKKNPNTWLIISGKQTFPAYAKKLKKQAEDTSDKIIFTGFTPDEELPYYYAACDVFTTCSLWEGFNMNIAEAQACGKPVVAFDVGPHREIVKEGKLVKKGDVKGFVKAAIEIAKKNKQPHI
jgi:1,2-diacylglycerol 3-alpha-glucosyltransferase